MTSFLFLVNYSKDRKMALLQLPSVEEAVLALIKMHNHQLSDSNHLRVSFSKSNIWTGITTNQRVIAADTTATTTTDTRINPNLTTTNATELSSNLLQIEPRNSRPLEEQEKEEKVEVEEEEVPPISTMSSFSQQENFNPVSRQQNEDEKQKRNESNDVKREEQNK